jgi:hypothetical protein
MLLKAKINRLSGYFLPADVEWPERGAATGVRKAINSQQICELFNNHINDLDHCNARRSGVAILLPFDGSK